MARSLKPFLRVGLFSAVLMCSSVAQSSTRANGGNADPTEEAVKEFYSARAGKPLWFDAASGDAPQRLLTLLSTAEVDGVSNQSGSLGSLLLAVRQSHSGDRAAITRAETMLSRAFVNYARELQGDPRVGVIYVDADLKPTPSPAADLLASAAEAPSLSQHLENLGWMNPIYGQLRQGLRTSSLSEKQRYILSLNLQRARALPARPDRYVLVNTANQRLYMLEKGKVVDEMKVISGRSNAQTPLMNAYIRLAVVNPYWNVPADITARLAPNVLKRGISYLKQQGYEVFSDSGSRPNVIDAANIDWKAVAAGKVAVQLRQLPGPSNSMGRVKFMFPNSQGVWLHDTPSTELFASSERLQSAGCVRLEDARRLGTWLFGQPLSLATKEREKQLALPQPVPVYITYLTAVPDKSSIRFIDDVYRRDPPRHEPDGV